MSRYIVRTTLGLKRCYYGISLCKGFKKLIFSIIDNRPELNSLIPYVVTDSGKLERYRPGNQSFFRTFPLQFGDEEFSNVGV